MSHKLDDVLEAVLESYVQHPRIGKIGETQFPKRHLILAVLKKLQYASLPPTASSDSKPPLRSPGR